MGWPAGCGNLAAAAIPPVAAAVADVAAVASELPAR